MTVQHPRPRNSPSADPKEFRLLSDADFERLSAEEKIAYLKGALEMRHAIDAQLDAWRYKAAPPRMSFKHY